APLSVPVPMPPSMSRREALGIWMLRIAMKAPIMPASTAIHAVTLALSWREAGGALICEEGSATVEATFDIANLAYLSPGGPPMIHAWSHFLSENRRPLFRKMLQKPDAGPAAWCRWSGRRTCRGAAHRRAARRDRA